MIQALAQVDIVGHVAHYSIVLARITGLFIFLPVFGSNILPMRIRIAIAAVLAFVFLPFAPRLEVPVADVVSWTLVAVRELAAGLGLGITARVIFTGIEAAAQLVSGQSGFSLASMVDPASGDQSAAPNMLVNLMTIALFLAADLHHLFILGVHRSYELLPPAIVFPDVSGLERITGALGMRLFTVAVELSAPALVVTVAVDLVMVLVGKAMPQIPILIVAYPFKMALGLVAIALLVLAVGSAIGWIGRTISSDGAAVLHAFAGAG